MKELFFYFGFIWPIASVASLLLGPLYGLDRTRLKNELVVYWNVQTKSGLEKLARRLALIFSWLGFLFPLIYPLRGFVVAIFFVLLI